MKKSIKKIMTSLLCVSTAVSLLVPSTLALAADQLSVIKERGTLLVGTSPDFAPREFYILNDKNEKEIVGSDITLAKAIADEIGVELKIVESDFNGVIANIQTASVDMGISGFSYTKERESVMDFSIGYSQETGENGYQGLLVTKELATKYKTLDELKKANLKIGAQGGSIQFELAMTLSSPTNVKQYGTMEAEVLALNSGDIDAVVVSSSSAEPMLTSFDTLVLLPEKEFNLDPENIYAQNVIGLPKTNDNKALLELVNKVIQDNIDSGNMKKWEDEAKALSAKSVE